MDLGLKGLKALVAGGSSGLGFATARELSNEGAQVAINGRDPGRLADAAVSDSGADRDDRVPRSRRSGRS